MSDDERITNLEMTIAHQQQELHDLGEVIHQQWAEIEKLKSDIKRLEATKADSKSDGEEGDVPPPHY